MISCKDVIVIKEHGIFVEMSDVIVFVHFHMVMLFIKVNGFLKWD